MKKRVLRLLGVAFILITSTGTAVAQPPAGSADSCNNSFESMTLDDILQQANRNGVPEQNARTMFAKVNKNGDEWICQKQLKGTNHYDFIDN
ncbi:MAG: hypothetical protein QOC92_791 [Acidimicrobiaceae bacterium]|jgi:hypothetical protein